MVEPSDLEPRYEWTCGTGDRCPVGWLRASLDDVAGAWETYTRWRAKWWRVPVPPVRRAEGTPAEMMAQIEAGYCDYVVLRTRSPWVAVGTRLDPISSEIAGLVPSPLVAIERAVGPGGEVSHAFRYIVPESEGLRWVGSDVDRIVLSEQHARGWDFYESGEPQLFEETDRYRLPDRSQRLTEDMLRRYAAALEIPLGGAEVATGEGLLLTEQDWPLGGCVDHDAANQELADLRRDAHRRAAPS